ncbi:MAG TPA: fibronectin type III domain-containing protein [Burkholderiales bacterium]|nr:fibronectin type III domain-containing protein [Burkholderiales bacterium]
MRLNIVFEARPHLGRLCLATILALAGCQKTSTVTVGAEQPSAQDTTAPSAPAGLTATPASFAEIDLAWTAATDDVGVTGYRLESCAGAGCSNFVQIAAPAGTSFSNTGLAASTSYSYRVRAVDATGNLGSYSSVAAASTPAAPPPPDTTPPSAPASLTATAASASEIDLGWSAATDNVGVTGYSLESCAGAGCSSFTPIATPTGTSFGNTGLAAATAYSYRVRAVDAAGNLGSYSAIATASTNAAPPPPPDTTPPSAPSGLTATAASSTQINLAWAAATDNVGVTGYRLESCAGAGCSNFAQIAAPAGTSFGSTGLTPGNSYSYRVRAVDAAGNLGSYSNIATASTPDTTPPGAPSNLTATASSQTQIDLAWSAATDNVGVAGYRVESCSGAGCSNFVQIAAPAGAAFSNTGLAAGSSHSYRVRAVDAAGNLGPYSNIAAASTPDTTPPTAPANLTATAISETQINLAWVAATDNVGVTGYRVESCAGAGCSNFAQIAAPSGTSFSNTGLAAGTPYSYRVRAVDAAGNLGSYSNIATASTPDATPPGAPANLTATAFSQAQIDLAWTAATDNVGVSGYRVERCAGAGCSNFAQIAAPAGTSFSNTGLAAGTSYSYRVRAADAAGNLGIYSNVATASTPDTTPPGAPGGLTATPVSSTQINLAWAAATDNVGVTGYHVESCAGAGCSNFAEIATPSATSFANTGLAASTSYSYRVRAADAAGNLGSYSSVAIASTPSSSPISVGITPRRGGLTLSQTLALAATVSNDVGSAGVTWTSSGGTLSGASATSATFSSSVAGSFTITATSVADASKSASATIGVTDLAGVFTQRYDSQRTGQNLQEYALTPGNVSASTFGKLFSCAVDAELYAQPLYVANLQIAGGKHNTVFVATQNDSVYAFDADAAPCVQRWKVSLLNGGSPVDPNDTGEAGDINTKIGITGTPVIDPVTGTLYVVSKTSESDGYHQRLHALNLVDGAEKFSGPAEIGETLTVAGSGDTGDQSAGCSAGAGRVPFCALRENQRPGLLLLNGMVYIAWASHGDITPYHGWVIGYHASNLGQAPVLFNTTPDGGLGGIWQSGAGPAADAAGNIYVITGNGDFDPTAAHPNYGDTFLKLGTASGLSVLDFFTPSNEGLLNSNDWDVGSGGAVVLPDSVGSAMHQQLLLGGDKIGVLYLIDRNAMSGFNGTDQVVQEVSVKSCSSGCLDQGIFSTPAYWQGNIYVVAIGDKLKKYTISNAVIATPPLQAGDTFGHPGASPAVSSSGATNGIVWAVNSHANGTGNGGTSAPAVLFAYDAATLTKLFSSPATAGAGAAGRAVKFVVPTVANGRVYLGTQTELSVFGLLP